MNKKRTEMLVFSIALVAASACQETIVAEEFTAETLPTNLYFLSASSDVQTTALAGCDVTFSDGSIIIAAVQTVALRPLGVDDLELPDTEVVIASTPLKFEYDVAFSASSRTLSRFAPGRISEASDRDEPITWPELDFAPACGEIDVVNPLGDEPFVDLIYLNDTKACRTGSSIAEPDFESSVDCMDRADFDSATNF